jgi:uncharacterized GH25 family protein
MSIKALVLNSYGKPVPNATITFCWKNGISKVQTDNNGIADSGREDTLVSIHAYGKKIYDLGKEGVYQREGIIKVKI